MHLFFTPMILPVGRIRSTGGPACSGKYLSHSLTMKQRATNAMIGSQNAWQSGTKYSPPGIFSLRESLRQERLFGHTSHSPSGLKRHARSGYSAVYNVMGKLLVHNGRNGWHTRMSISSVSTQNKRQTW